MDDENTYRMPKRINDPPTLLFWPVHQVLAFFICLGAGIMLEQTTLFAVLGLVLFKVVGYADQNYPSGVITHFLHWHDLALHMKPSKSVPPGSKREFFQ